MMELQHTVGKSPAMVECDISRMLDWTSMVNCMAFSNNRSTSNGSFFPEGVPEAALLCSPSQDYQRPHGKASSISNISQCQCGLLNVRDTHVLTPLFSAVITWTHANSCWPWKGPLETNRWCGLEAPIAWGARWILVGPLCGSFVSQLDGRRFPVWWPNAMLVVP
jgi:hypothetical protein